MLLFIAVIACTPASPPVAAPEPPVVPPPPAEGIPVVADPPAEDTSPAALYAACRDRLEGPEADGECTTDADCATTGCGGEVCTTAATTGLMFTCEDRPCFHVVEACGCKAGRCSWSLRAPAEPRMILKKGPAPQ